MSHQMLYLAALALIGYVAVRTGMRRVVRRRFRQALDRACRY